VLFSGASLLVGAVSRTDLLGHEHATGLAAPALSQSCTRRSCRLRRRDRHPTPRRRFVLHRRGRPSESTTTVGRERRSNPFLMVPAWRLHHAACWQVCPVIRPTFDHMRALNRRGPHVLGELPRLARLTPHDVQAPTNMASGGRHAIYFRLCTRPHSWRLPCGAPPVVCLVGRLGVPLVHRSSWFPTQPRSTSTPVRQLIRIVMTIYLATSMRHGRLEDGRPTC